MVEIKFDAFKIKEEIVEWIRQWFKFNGDGCNAVVGVSGGIDSSVVAALCVEALGRDRVKPVLLPYGEQRDIDYAYFLCGQLGIFPLELNIKKAVETILEQFPIDVSEQTRINLPPRIRMAMLYAVSQSINGRVANTSNLSESWVGYDTRYGDSVGDFSPLGRLTKTEIKELAKALGLSGILIDKIPEDGLCGRTDEDRFGFTYAILDRYIRTGEIDDANIKEKIDKMHDKNLFKMKMMDTFASDFCFAGNRGVA